MEIVKRSVHFDKVLNKSVIGQPMTPGYWKTKTLTNTKVTKLLLTYGGGMGGSAETLYVKRIPLNSINDDGFITVTTWEGTEVVINPRYIVKAYQMDIVKGIYHSENNNYTVGDWEYCFIVEPGKKITTTTGYDQVN